MILYVSPKIFNAQQFAQLFFYSVLPWIAYFTNSIRSEWEMCVTSVLILKFVYPFSTFHNTPHGIRHNKRHKCSSYWRLFFVKLWWHFEVRRLHSHSNEHCHTAPTPSIELKFTTTFHSVFDSLTVTDEHHHLQVFVYTWKKIQVGWVLRSGFTHTRFVDVRAAVKSTFLLSTV